jgi:hypothetical protein
MKHPVYRIYVLCRLCCAETLWLDIFRGYAPTRGVLARTEVLVQWRKRRIASLGVGVLAGVHQGNASASVGIIGSNPPST